ncbi:MAG: hypothetical protein U5L11_17275 [Arhodomonas sp.]|nr:hypothetical protein [Arhodomonas sp.]
MAENDPPPLGTYLGVAGDPAPTGLVEGSDGLLLLGAILSDTNFAVSERQIDMRRAIQALGREVRIGYHAYPEIPLDELVDALLERAGKVTIDPGAATVTPSEYPRDLPADDEPIRPSDIAAAVNDLMADSRAPAHGRRYGRLPVHGHGHRAHRAHRAGLLRRDGLRGTGGARGAGGHWQPDPDPGR